MTPPPYSTETILADASADELRRLMRDTARFGALCRQCGGFGRSWLCPPVDQGIIARMESFTRTRIVGLRITPQPGCTLGGTDIMRMARTDFERTLLQLESELSGMACGLSGSCPYCPGMECARTAGQPCRHPELARPSLEALGFDVTAISHHYLHTEILWEQAGRRPAYYMLVGAIFF